jgi:hypothetical protein
MCFFTTSFAAASVTVVTGRSSLDISGVAIPKKTTKQKRVLADDAQGCLVQLIEWCALAVDLAAQSDEHGEELAAVANDHAIAHEWDDLLDVLNVSCADERPHVFDGDGRDILATGGDQQLLDAACYLSRATWLSHTCDVEKPIFVHASYIACVQPSIGVDRLLREVSITHDIDRPSSCPR